MRNNNEKSTPVHSKDKAARLYFNQNQPFAEIFDFLLYQGKQKIDPSCLSPLDPSELNLDLDEKRRDVIKLYSAKCDEQITYLIFGLEVQSSVDRSMAIRMMVYDAMRYHEQLRKGELKPIISAVINLSGKEWKAPKEIKELFLEVEPQIREYISNHQIHVIDPHKMSEEEIERFEGDIGSLMGMFKYIHDKEKMLEFMQKEKGIRKEGKIMMKAYFNVEFKEEEQFEEEETNALLEILEDKKNEGEQIGLERGKMDTARRMIEDGLKDELISKYSGLEMDKIEELKYQTKIIA